jgi:hypothetical protein
VPSNINSALAATPTFSCLKQPKDRRSKSPDRENAGRFGWQAWRAARSQYPRFACHADQPGDRFSAAPTPVMRLRSLLHYRNPTHGFLSPLSAGGQMPLLAFVAAGLMAATPGRNTPRTALCWLSRWIRRAGDLTTLTTRASGTVCISAESTLVPAAEFDRVIPAGRWTALFS